ncbi:MAG: uridine kinase [Bacillota bacterium]
MGVLLIGIGGGTASGKTTLARILKESFQDDVTILRLDYYYHDLNHFEVPENEINFDHPNAFEIDLLIKHLQKLKAGRAIERPVYSFKTNRRLDRTKKVNPSKILIVEGILALYYLNLCEQYDLKIYVDTDCDIRLLRRITRDIRDRGRTLESVKKQYLSTVKPMHEQFVEPSKSRADIIIPHGGLNEIANDLLIEKIKGHLQVN